MVMISIIYFRTIIYTVSYGKIAFAGITIVITGWMLLIGIPFMFSALFYFIDAVWSGILFVIGIIMLLVFAYFYFSR